MSKTKDWLMDQDEVSIEDYPEVWVEFIESLKRAPSYIPTEGEDDGLPF